MTLRHAVAVPCALLLGSALTACSTETRAATPIPRSPTPSRRPPPACRDSRPSRSPRPPTRPRRSRLHEPSHRGDVRRRAPDQFDDADYDDTPHARHLRLPHLLDEVRRVRRPTRASSRTTVSWAWFRPSAKAWEQGALVPLRRDRRELRQPRVPRAPPDRPRHAVRGVPRTTGSPAPTGRRSRRARRSPARRSTPGGRHHGGSSPARRRLPRRPRRGEPHPLLLRRVGEAWHELPGRVRVRIHVLPPSGWKAGIRRSVCWAKTTK